MGIFHTGYTLIYWILNSNILPSVVLGHGNMMDCYFNNKFVFYRVIYENKLHCNMSVFIK